MLDDRKSAILRAIVQTYIETAQPVGSSSVSEASGVGVSSATVRNDMTVLEIEGYLSQPHTSAGRVPTEKAYRHYVDTTAPAPLEAPKNKAVRAFFADAHGELESMLQSTSRLLSKLTSTTAMVVGEHTDVARFLTIHLVGLSAGSVLVVAVLSSGDVIKAHFERPEGADDDVLHDVGAAMSGALAGSRVSDTWELPATLTGVEPSGAESVTAAVAAAAVAALHEGVSGGGHKVWVEGASHIADAFEAADTLREVLGLLEQQLTVVSLIHDVLDRGLTVAIGSETGVAPLAECSLVVAPYSIGGEPAGTIGVLGPTRMNYQETLAAVAVVSRRLSNLLTEGTEPEGTG